MQFLELAESRCTTRGFLEKKLSESDLTYILEAGRMAPTACNRQPQRIIVASSEHALNEVKKAYNTFGAPVVLIVCQDRTDPLIRPFDGKCSGDLDIGIVCDHMMLAARERGIGSVMVGLFDPEIIRGGFDIPPEFEVTALLILGYPAEDFADLLKRKRRKPLGQTVMFEKAGTAGDVPLEDNSTDNRIHLVFSEQ
ncbi:MAG: nitroreductase family protein [Sphaerochaetaceae bacterium]|nr:nitroreductase family protein [Sphaerochaetaceae bacterium]